MLLFLLFFTEFRKLIVQTLGKDIYEAPYLPAIANGETSLGIQPPNRLDLQNFNDYYH